MNENKNQATFIFSDEFVGFTNIPNYIFKCKELSFKAIGIYCSILRFQNSETHSISVAGLMAIHADGQTSVQNGLNELIEHGFLSREYLRNEKGQIAGVRYTVYMKPIDTQCVKPKVDFHNTDNTNVENQRNKKENNKKQNIKKEKDDDAKLSTDTKKESINQSSYEQFKNSFEENTGKKILAISKKQKAKISKLIEEFGEETVLEVMKLIKQSTYLRENLTLDKFLDVEIFTKIAQGHYKDYSASQAQPKGKFYPQNTHGWDFNELEELERKRIESLVDNNKL